MEEPIVSDVKKQQTLTTFFCVSPLKKETAGWTMAEQKFF